MNIDIFNNLWQKNFAEAVVCESLESLGDRKLYIGSSDVGSCPRKVFLAKTQPASHSVEKNIVFQRGHLAEGIVRKGLIGLDFKEQFEVKDASGALRSHIDFLLESEDSISIIECKSIQSSEIEAPYDSWILQVQFQLFLLEKTLTNNTKPLKAFVFAVNVNTGYHKVFEVEKNPVLQDLALQKARVLWKALKTGVEPEAEEQNYCSSCEFKANCPLLQRGVSNDIAPAEMLKLGEQVVLLQSEIKPMEVRLKALREKLLAEMQTSQIRKIQVGDNFVTATSGSSYQSLDTKAWKEAEPDLYQEVFEKYAKTTNKSASLLVK